MRRKLNKRKKLLLSLVSVVLVCAVGAGIWLGVSRSGAEPVLVFPFQYLGMTEYWGDSRETYGPVTTDKIQTVFLSDTQTVTEILAREGDTGRGEGEAPAGGGQGPAPADQGNAAHGDSHRVPRGSGGRRFPGLHPGYRLPAVRSL